MKILRGGTVARESVPHTEIAIFIGALLLYGLLPSSNNNYADDSLRWAYAITLPSGLINSHHLYLNAMRKIYHVLQGAFGAAIDPVRFLSAYCALWGAIGLVSLYQLLRLLGCGRAALPGTLACAFTANYWAYSIVSDVYIPATALLIMGTYAFLSSLRTDSPRNRVKWTIGAVASFVLMTLHHQAYSIFVPSLTVAVLFVREGSWSLRLKQSITTLAITGLTTLAIYGAVYRTMPNHGESSFQAFVSGYAESFNALPDQKLVSLSTLTNSIAGELRALLPYHVIFRSVPVAHAIQQRFPYRNVYPYPYLVRSLSHVDITLILLGIAVACMAGVTLFIRGSITIVRERKAALAILLAMIPQALFFIWWEGISDEFWIWSLPLIVVLTAKGASYGERWPVRILIVGTVGLFVSTLLGAALLFANPDNDIDAVNQRYLAHVASTDLLVGFNQIQSAARTHLAMERQGFQYFNIFSHSTRWSSDNLAELNHEVAETLERGGKVFVDPYILHPPLSNMASIRLLNKEFEAQRLDIISLLRKVDPARIEWVQQTATVPGYFVE